MRFPVTLTMLALVTTLAGCTATAPHKDITLDGAHRSAEAKARDRYRHPAETLAFFEVEPHMTVVEIWPGPGGWYTDILAPLLRDKGTLYAAQFPPDSGIPFFTRSLERFREKLASNPAVYDNITVTHLYPPAHTDIAPPGSADRVLTFRNVHNWAKAGNAAAVFTAMYDALRPGGILGVVEHRAPEGRSLEAQIESGYMTESYVIGLAEQAGFALLEKSEVNANSADSADHPAGVWTLPPTLRLGDEQREHYLDVGESDRMTLKFQKPL